jgi:hypothetical protein
MAVCRVAERLRLSNPEEVEAQLASLRELSAYLDAFALEMECLRESLRTNPDRRLATDVAACRSNTTG